MDKQQISQKVAKVREVVKGVSTNDIILALHSYDMSVERTIQAFCDDGASNALDDWVTPAGGNNKNKNKKKKEAARSVETTATVEVKSAVKATAAAPTVSSAVQPTVPTASKPTINVAPQKAKPTQTAEVHTSSTNGQVQTIFKSLRSALNEREKTILSQGGDNLTLDPAQLLSLICSFGSVNVKSSVTTNNNNNNIVKAKTTSPVVSNGTVIKHATSQSSISSSIGADSGVNLSPTHKEEKKVAQIATGGIQMSSDGLSAEQLAELQRSFEKSLAARGIDASVLSGVTSGDMPHRSKPRKQQNSKPKDQKAKTAPQISIMP